LNASQAVNKNKNQKSKVKFAFDWLPHVLFLLLIKRGIKVRKQPTKYGQVILLGYFWAVTYPWTYQMYKFVGNSYLIPKI
jgi:hypothetical protein